MLFHSLCGVIIVMQGDRKTDKHAHSQLKTLTETTVAIVYHEISSQGSGGEVVHAAGPVRHVPHHNGICLCEPAKYTHRDANQHSHTQYARPDDHYRSDQYTYHARHGVTMRGAE